METKTKEYARGEACPPLHSSGGGAVVTVVKGMFFPPRSQDSLGATAPPSISTGPLPLTSDK